MLRSPSKDRYPAGMTPEAGSEGGSAPPGAGRRAARDADGYRIGTVAGLTGLDPHTIRAWERRHDAVRPARTARGLRLYDDAAIERLQLLKGLVDCGEPIGRIAHRSDEELRSELRRMAGLSMSERGLGQTAVPLRAGLLAPVVAAQLATGAHRLPGVEVVVSGRDRTSLLAELRRSPCELMILELEALGPEPLRDVEAYTTAAGARLIVILYQFAPRSLLTRLARRGCRLVRAPIDLDQLDRTLADLVATEGARARTTVERPPVAPGATPPERRFDDLRLARISEISTTIDCECPHHLSDLIRSLVAFEAYSRACESRDAEDASMHRRLADGTGRARAAMEDLLDALCAYEGIDV